MEEIRTLLAMSEEERTKYFHALPGDKTSTLLVEDLEKEEKTEARDAIIGRARAFGYDDFKFDMLYGHENVFCPKVLLVGHLMDAGLGHIAREVMNGKYD